ncbi:hypothetical protein TNCV_4356731 [Trichonephila clavipes]|nr:hypothetical protein TNCV_4356731 [Trichonephila clavipes]
MHVKPVAAQSPQRWRGGKVKRGVPAKVSSSSLDYGSSPIAVTLNSSMTLISKERVQVQVSSSSLDHGSKLRGPSPKALV